MDIVAIIIVLLILAAQFMKGPPEDGPNPWN
jgi:hypothetical protein